MATILTEVQLVRDLTTEDTTILSTEKIESYLLEFHYKPRWCKVYTVVAKCLDIIHKDDKLWTKLKIDKMELTDNNIESVISNYTTRGIHIRVMG